MAMLYFDHAATTPIHSDVLNDLVKSLEMDFANPASTHKLGRNLKERIDLMRTDFKLWLTKKTDGQFYFTASATESNNTVIFGLNLKENDAILYFESDHKSITHPVENLAQKGIKIISHQHNNDGTLKEFITDSTLDVKLIVLTFVNSQSGNILDVNELALFYKSKFPKAHIHVDAVQGLGKIKYTFNDKVDSIAITGHKIGGPKGVAGLYLKKGVKVEPLIVGGGQQDGFRASTEPYPLIKAFHQAAKMSLANTDENFTRIQSLNNNLTTHIKRIIPEVEFPFKETSPYIMCLIIPKISSDVLIRHLEIKEVYVSSTSACSSKIKGFNSTFKALMIPEKFHKNVLRISFSAQTTAEDMDKLTLIFEQVWSDLKYLIR